MLHGESSASFSTELCHIQRAVRIRKDSSNSGTRLAELTLEEAYEISHCKQAQRCFYTEHGESGIVYNNVQRLVLMYHQQRSANYINREQVATFIKKE
jgi:hypothetical protein